MDHENDETETKQCKACGREKKLRDFKRQRGGSRANTCTECASAAHKRTLASKKVARVDAVSDAKAEATAKPCSHKTICGDENVAHELPRFFEAHERAPRGAEWHVCVWCGQAKLVQVYDVGPSGPRLDSILLFEPGGNKPAWLDARPRQLPGGRGEFSTSSVQPGAPASAAVQSGAEALARAGERFGDPGKEFLMYDKPVAEMEPLLDFATAKAPLTYLGGDEKAPERDDPETPALAACRGHLRALQTRKVDLLQRLTEVEAMMESLEAQVEIMELRMENRWLKEQLAGARQEAGVA